MENTNDLMRLLAAQASALGLRTEEGDKEAAYIEKLLERFKDVICVECSHQAIRHTVALEGMVNLQPETAKRKPCGGVAVFGREVEETACDCPGLKFGPRSQAVTIRRVAIVGCPAQAPADWLVFAAPRYLDGTKTWEDWAGPSLHGRYYAAVDPKDPLAAAMIETNAELDGWIIEFVTMDQVNAWAERQADEDGFSRDDLAKVHEAHLLDWWAANNHRVFGEVKEAAQGGWHVVAFDELKRQVKSAKKLLDDGALTTALALFERKLQDLPDRAAWDARQAQQKLTADDNIAADQHLNAVLEKIGPHKYED
jgi:hypothetical protein